MRQRQDVTPSGFTGKSLFAPRPLLAVPIRANPALLSNRLKALEAVPLRRHS